MSVAEVDVPSSMAALLIGSVPLWVILYRRLLGDRVAAISVAAVLIGFLGMAILLLPGKQTGGAPLLALLTCVGAAAMWAGGSVASTRLELPRDPFVSGGWQMLLGGGICLLTGGLVGELGDFHPAEFSSRSLIAFVYLVVFGSWLAFTAYAWLLQNAPVSRVATYAYVNPVVAIALGWAILDEAVTLTRSRARPSSSPPWPPSCAPSRGARTVADAASPAFRPCCDPTAGPAPASEPESAS